MFSFIRSSAPAPLPGHAPLKSLPQGDILTINIKSLQHLLSEGTITSVDLINIFMEQMAKYEHYLRAQSEANGQAQYDFAVSLDRERAEGKLRGPLHGIPFLIKLIEAGGIPLGKTNLTELSNWKWSGTNMTSGWSAANGQTQSAYVCGGVKPDGRDGHSNPSGSSSGSAVAVSAGYVPFALGIETDGSLVVPEGRAALYTIKPTMGLVSTDGVCPISHNFDSPGPMAKTPSDIAIGLDALIERNTDSRAGKSYTDFLTGSWKGISVGTLDPEIWKFPDEWVRPVESVTKEMNDKYRAAYTLIRSRAKHFAENVDLPTADALNLNGENSKALVTQTDFQTAFPAYLSFLSRPRIKSLPDLIQFNFDHADRELPPHHNNQEILLACCDLDLSPAEYERHLAHLRSASREKGIDYVLDKYGLDVIIGPADSFMTSFATASGYPVAGMPLSCSEYNGRAFGVAAWARKGQEGLLIEVMSAWEEIFGPREVPDLEGHLKGM